jgi:SAM-dependent methyltransferase
LSIPESDPGWGHLERLRADELRSVVDRFPPSARVLELGAGSGFQSAWLRRLGHTVSAVDVEEGGEEGGHEHPVTVYDGVHLPFDAGAFDVVFSSNVLEHVRDLDGLLADVRRVLAPGGVVISILPSSTWRLWTTVAHYPFLAKFAVTRRLPTPSRSRAAVNRPVSSVSNKLRKIVAPTAHGEFPSASRELLTFRRRWWTQRLEQAGFRIVRVESLGLFYTGYSIFERASVAARHTAARVLGSSTYVVIAEPAAE